jgi:hypothetical protein
MMDKSPPQLRKILRERGVTTFEDGRPITNRAKKPELLKLLGFEPKKTGKPTWAPAQKLTLKNKREGFRYRWCEKDSQNLQKKEAEGWVYANAETGAPAEHVNPGDSTPTTSTQEYRELVAMALPEEIGEARDEYFRALTEKQTSGLKGQLQGDLDEAARKHGGYRASATGQIVID